MGCVNSKEDDMKNDTVNTGWYAGAYRKVFFDFHNYSTAVNLAAHFDAERWAKALLKIKAQAVSVCVKCGFGWSYYQKGRIRYIHPQIPSGLDMLGEQIQALHKHGIKTIGYYHIFNSEPVAEHHPDWLHRDKNGESTDIVVCPLSPLTEEWMLPHIEEAITNYDVDAMFFDGLTANNICYCEYCKKRFLSDTGLNLPKDSKDVNFQRYLVWKLDMYKQVRHKICSTIHRHRPEMPVSFNWCYSLRTSEPVPDEVGSLMADIHPDDQVFNSSYQAKHWALTGKPFDIMNTAFLRWWGDWGCKPATAMKQEVATVLANGGLTWIGYQMTHEFDVQPAVMNELGKTLAFVKDRENLLRDALPVPYIAVLSSSDSCFAQDEIGFQTDQVGLRGIHRLLLESGLPYHFVNESTLFERLNDFKVVVLPDQRRLSPELVEGLNRFVKNGGVLISTYLTGTLDENYRDTGKFAIEDLMGVRLEKRYEQPSAYIEVTHPALKRGVLDMPHMCEGRFVFARPISDDVKVLARLLKIYLRQDGKPLLPFLNFSPPADYTGYPAITLRKAGKGYAIYIAGQVFRAYQKNNQWNIKGIVDNLFRMTVKKRIIEINTPVWLEVVLTRQDKRTIIHLINHHGDRPVDKNYACTEKVPAVRDIKIKILCERPVKVVLEPGRVKTRWSWKNGILQVCVDEVDIHRAVVID